MQITFKCHACVVHGGVPSLHRSVTGKAMLLSVQNSYHTPNWMRTRNWKSRSDRTNPITANSFDLLSAWNFSNVWSDLFIIMRRLIREAVRSLFEWFPETVVDGRDYRQVFIVVVSNYRWRNWWVTVCSGISCSTVRNMWRTCRLFTVLWRCFRAGIVLLRRLRKGWVLF